MTEDLPPIVREFEVRCSVDHAFDTWTRRIDLWWPLAGHSVSRENAASVAIEPRCGGHIFETTRNGHTILWGTVNVWEPPNRFGYLWHIGERGTSEATQVTITFTGVDSGRTRVLIKHEGWARAGPKAASRRRGNERGWDGLEGAFTRFVNEEAKHEP
jgi:uncharacterized protein YndB with AHSA1/START domain